MGGSHRIPLQGSAGVSPNAAWFLLKAKRMECASLEAVSKLNWSGLSALDRFCHFIPGALPQAGIVRAFGALTAFCLCF